MTLAVIVQGLHYRFFRINAAPLGYDLEAPLSSKLVPCDRQSKGKAFREAREFRNVAAKLPRAGCSAITPHATSERSAR